MKKRVVVTGLGVISPVGNNVNIFWQALQAGKSGIGPLTTFDATHFDSRIAGEVKNFVATEHFNSKEAKRMAKFAQYAVVAAKQAIEDAKIDIAKEDPERAGVYIGSGIGDLKIIEDEHNVYLEKGPGRLTPFLIPTLIANAASGQVSIYCGFKGPNCCAVTACASGAHALGEAFRLIQNNEADVMVAGGSESAITHLGIGGFCALKALSKRNDAPEKASRPFDKERDGFVMAEGCGIVVLESLEHALKRGARIYAEMCGFGMSGDAYHMTAPDPTGAGAIKAMSRALEDSGLKPTDVNYINAHGTSTALNDKIETLAIKTLFGAHAEKLVVNSTKSITGHLLGAAGGVEFIVCCLSIRDAMLHPTINQENPDPDCDLDYVPNVARKANVEVALSNSLGFGGHNATIAVKKFKP